jgi:hypothetical protein
VSRISVSLPRWDGEEAPQRGASLQVFEATWYPCASVEQLSQTVVVDVIQAGIIPKLLHPRRWK